MEEDAKKQKCTHNHYDWYHQQPDAVHFPPFLVVAEDPTADLGDGIIHLAGIHSIRVVDADPALFVVRSYMFVLPPLVMRW